MMRREEHIETVTRLKENGEETKTETEGRQKGT